MREYDQIAAWYTETRNPRIGVRDVAAFVRGLAPQARILDFGCGDGVPISQLLARKGFDLVGLDSSREMIARYRANFPAVAARCERVQEARFAEGTFEAVVAWGVLFHLSRADQRAAIQRVSEWLKPGGRFLFTSGDQEAVTEGEMDGTTFRYVSLGANEYHRLIERCGMRMETAYRDAWANCIYVAQKV
jgi:2-polyprenyl-3-methyl-5-hydroxy-6-metoxy-1,4-benzoquinol methylase